MPKGASKKSVEIVQKDNAILRKIAERVDIQKIGKTKLAKIIEDMSEALHSQDDGVAIAAPQIGVSLRVFVVSAKTFELAGRTKKNEGKDMVFINPKIVKVSKQKHMAEEGCLSVRWLYGEVSRALKATIEAEDIHGKKFTMGASGILAQVFQHEIDHLDGILFIDKAKNLEEIPPETIRNNELTAN